MEKVPGDMSCGLLQPEEPEDRDGHSESRSESSNSLPLSSLLLLSCAALKRRVSSATPSLLWNCFVAPGRVGRV